jgi:hypothetical protein
MKHKLIMEAWRKFIAEDIDLEAGSDMEAGPAGAQQYKFNSKRARGAGSHARTSGVEGEKAQDAENKKGSRLKRHSNRERPKDKINCIIIHESGVATIGALINVLNDRQAGLSVNWAITSGESEELVDSKYMTYHAKGRNVNSIGIEVNHQYHKGKAGEKTYSAPWFSKSVYGAPTVETLEETWDITKKLCRQYDIPKTIANLEGTKYDLSADSSRRTGIVAHGAYASHKSDGLFPCLYMAIRMNGYPPAEARKVAIKLTTGVKRGVVTIPGYVIGAGGAQPKF